MGASVEAGEVRRLVPGPELDCRQPCPLLSSHQAPAQPGPGWNLFGQEDVCHNDLVACLKVFCRIHPRVSSRYINVNVN